MTVQLAHLYVTLCLAQVFFHFALILGAPLAAWSPGGGPAGRASRRAKALSGLAIPVLLAQAAAMLAAAGFPGLGQAGWAPLAGWVATGVPAAGAALALVSAARADRTLWLPLESVMVALSLAVMTR